MSEAIKNNDTKNIITEPMIKANLSQFWLGAFDFAFFYMIKKSFFALRIKNAENYNLRNSSMSNIIFTNHSCWWDGLVAYTICRQLFKTEMHMMIEELHRFPLLAKIGAFSVKKDSAYSPIRTLTYSAEILNNPENSLFIYPQGEVKPPDYRPVKFAGGISYLCKKLNGVNLIPIAQKYCFLREDRPEILVEVGKPIVLDNNSINRKEFTEYLEAEFTKLLDGQKEDISAGKLEEYEFLIKSRLCVPKLIEKHFNPLTRLFSD